MGDLEKQYGKGFLDSIKFDPPDIKETASPNIGNAGAKNALGIDWSNPASAAAKNVIAGPIEDNLGIFTKSSGGGGENWFNKSIGRMGGLSNMALIGIGTINSFLPQRITSKGVDNLNKVFSVASNIPVVGKYALAALFFMNAIDSLGATKLATLNNNQEIQDTLANTGGGYGDFMADWDAASALSGQRAGLFANHTALNNQIYDANRLMSILQGIVGKKKTDDTLIALMGDRANERTMLDLNGGFGNVMFGRLGLKVEILPKVHAILNKPKVVDTLTEFEEEVPEFKEGGKMNVIPEGSLHARLHHMENAEGLTKKGIPVVSIAEGGELEQQAEIELNEIIFNLEVTLTLEKLMEDGSDNAAIEAGKLLVKEIFENTDDRTGLLKLLEPDKKEPTTEDIVKNHQAFLLGGSIKPSFDEWYKTVPKDRNNIENYNLKRAYELAPWEELERWRTATLELLNDSKYHLKTFYWNDKGEGEFVKKNGHPTLIKELEAYFTNKDFREKYDLDMSGDYFKYIKKKND